MSNTSKENFEFVYQATHRVYYSTEKHIPIKDVIIALQGLEGLLKPLPKLMQGLTGIEVNGCEFLVEKIEAGSLLEDIVIRFFFKDKENLDAFVDKLSENKAVKTTIITVAITGLVGYGLHLAMGDSPAPQINATNSTIIQNGSGQLNIHPDVLKALIRESVVDKKSLAESSLKIINPARTDKNANIEFDDSLIISHAAVSEAPKKIEMEANERLEEFKQVVLTLRAANLDSKKSGWAGRLGVREERLPIELDPAVSEADIFGRVTVIVDAALIYKEKGKSRELRPSRIYVRKVWPQKT